MSILKAIFHDLFSSKAKKVSLHMDELVADTRLAIATVERDFQAEAPLIAVACRELVIALPRGKEGYMRAYDMYARQKEQRNALHAASWMASRLIQAHHICARDPGNSLAAMPGIAFIQGMLDGFFQRHGVPAWNGRYYEHTFHTENGIEVSDAVAKVTAGSTQS